MIFKSVQVRMKNNRKKCFLRDMESNKKGKHMPIWILIRAVTHSKEITLLKKSILIIDLLLRITGASRVMAKQKKNSKENLRLTQILITWWIIIHRFLAGQIFQGIHLDQGKILKLKMILFQILKRKIIKMLKMILTLYMVEIKEVNASKVKIGMRLSLLTMLNRVISFTLNQSLTPKVLTKNQIKIQPWKERMITQ